MLGKEGALMRDRQLLAREVEFLRQQALTINESDIDKVYSSRRHLVDDILNVVRTEDEVGKRLILETAVKLQPPSPPEACPESTTD